VLILIARGIQNGIGLSSNQEAFYLINPELKQYDCPLLIPKKNGTRIIPIGTD